MIACNHVSTLFLHCSRPPLRSYKIVALGVSRLLLNFLVPSLPAGGKGAGIGAALKNTGAEGCSGLV